MTEHGAAEARARAALLAETSHLTRILIDTCCALRRRPGLTEEQEEAELAAVRARFWQERGARDATDFYARQLGGGRA